MIVPLLCVVAAAQPQPTSTPSPTPVAAPSEPTVDLRLRWESDAAGRYTNRMRQQVTYTGTYSATISQLQEIEIERAVARQSAGSATPDPGDSGVAKPASDSVAGSRVTDTIRRVVLSVKSGDTSIAFDSNTPARDGVTDEFGVLRSLLGRQTSFAVKADGTVSEVKGLDAMVDSARARAGESPAAASILDQYRASMSDDAMKRSLQELLALVPGRGVRVGETWSRTTTVSLGSSGSLSVTSTHTLASRDGAKATIKTTSALALQAVAGAAASFTLRDALGQGEAVLDVERGVLLSRTYSLAMTLDSKSGNQLNSQKIENSTEMIRQ